MIVSRRHIAPLFLCAALASACTQQRAQTASTSQPPPVTATPAVAETTMPPAGADASPPADAGAGPQNAFASEAPGVPATPTPLATPTPDPNLLSHQNGTIVRTFPSTDQSPRDAIDGPSVRTTDPGPWTYVYELPGVATLARVSARLPAKGANGEGGSVAFATSTTSASTGFTDAGTIASGATSDEQSLSLPATRARWVRVTLSRTGGARPAERFAAFGTIAPPPSSRVAGTYVRYDKAYANGAFATAPSASDPWHLQVVGGADGSVNGLECNATRISDAYPGTLDGRVWNWTRGGETGTFIANDEGSLLVEAHGSYVWARTSDRPAYCQPVTIGGGRTNVVMLEQPSWYRAYPANKDWIKDAPELRISQAGAALLEPSLLQNAAAVWLNGLCEPDRVLTSAQQRAVMQWVQNGHKLLITDSDMCKKTNYAFLPYAFQSDNPGAHGAKGDRLIQVEDDALGTSDTSDKAHFFDPKPWTVRSNQLGDANTVTTHDDHWCGHLFGTNVNHVNGFMQTYALYGKGVIIYDGFDADDSDEPPYQRVRRLELALPVPPDLPCTQKASLSFVIEPNRDAKFSAGKASTAVFAMELLANQGWRGHVNVTTTGDFRARATPSSFDVDGTTQPLKIAVSIPASAKPGSYAVIVNGDAGGGQTAQATIQLHADVSIAKQIKTQRRIRVYGIHFDVDKATIKPQSEPVIAQIAAVMKQNAAWRFRVEGHTDSDGGLQHNAVLSQHRAESVVNDLVKRYHIARNRLVPKGFGYSKPVAPNTTAAGKALNRRVELYLLNP